MSLLLYAKIYALLPLRGESFDSSLSIFPSILSEIMVTVPALSKYIPPYCFASSNDCGNLSETFMDSRVIFSACMVTTVFAFGIAFVKRPLSMLRFLVSSSFVLSVPAMLILPVFAVTTGDCNNPLTVTLPCSVVVDVSTVVLPETSRLRAARSSPVVSVPAAVISACSALTDSCAVRVPPFAIVISPFFVITLGDCNNPPLCARMPETLAPDLISELFGANQHVRDLNIPRSPDSNQSCPPQ